ncbi:hypothetical protein K491DRAFT_698168 [Lophiostoma macrostomum CBS 122681]|uniref:Uncharacterized protein n=1 Tax=Lophiostoma macrostomum CBS 122681 TaxID=1314788 RepID=A0A6A6SP85_9PLEO|nr:hypothetical protein K491DRAFT_698168 [Lophiostoma macrostomum CBS 122681]
MAPVPHTISPSLFPFIPYIGVAALVISIFLELLISALEHKQRDPIEVEEGNAEERECLLEKSSRGMGYNTLQSESQTQSSTKGHLRCRSLYDYCLCRAIFEAL